MLRVPAHVVVIVLVIVGLVALPFAAVLLGADRWSQLPPDRPKIEAKQKTDRRPTTNGQPNAETDGAETTNPAVAEVHPEAAQADASKDISERGQEISEYWTVLGYSVRVTDSLLVVFNFLLFVGTMLLWWSTRRSVNIAERALIELERCFVTVEVTEPGIEGVSSGRFSVAGKRLEYRCLNYGRSAVHITEIYRTFPIIEGADLPEPVQHDFEQSRHLPAGVIAARDFPYIEREKPMTIFDSRIYEEGSVEKYRVFFLGYVTYLDVFGDLYVNGFCFVFDPYGDRFVRIGDGRYNYIEKLSD